MQVFTRREVLATLAAPAALRSAATKQPNVVLILSDDQGYGDFASKGNSQVRTPVLDRLAAEGAEFTRFYVSPVCAPTRASLLTGRYNLRGGVHGVTSGYETLHPTEVTIAQVLKKAGYRTGIFGKWHLGENYPYVPHARGFDEFVGMRTGHWTDYWDSTLERNGRPLPTKGYITETLTNEAIRFVKANASKPFFLYVPYNVPHSPFQGHEELFDYHKSKGATNENAAVYAMVENMDTNIGRLLNVLPENTIVLFLCDNGPATARYTYNLRGRKAGVYEGGVRSPLYVRWPGKVKAGTKIDLLSAHIDILPTVAELCGASVPADRKIDGCSLAPLLKDSKSEWPERTFFTHADRGPVPSVKNPSAVRTQRYNLINGTELYDILADPAESKNVAAEHPEVAAKLKAAYHAWFDEVTSGVKYDRLPIPVGHAEENPATLTAPQATLLGGLKFKNSPGYAHDWIVGFSANADAAAYWEVAPVRAGRYQVTVRYLSPDTGPRVHVRTATANLVAPVTKPTSMEPVKHRDLFKRTQSPEMHWGSLKAGVVELAARDRITITVEQPGGFELKDLSLERI
jgi:arylsulfatase A-like enzyme